MKKAIAFLLVIVMISAILTGCYKRGEVRAAALAWDLSEEAFTNASAIYGLCAVEQECLEKDGIVDSQTSDDYVAKCLKVYEEKLKEWRKEGLDVTDSDMSIINRRSDKIGKEYDYFKEAADEGVISDEISATAERIFQAHWDLLSKAKNVYGPADQFFEDCGSIYDEICSAHTDMKALLEKYQSNDTFKDLIGK